MKLYAVEITDTGKNCGIQARNIDLFKKLVDAKTLAVSIATLHDKSLGNNPDIRIGEFLDKTAKLFNAKDGHEEYTDALAYITIVETS